MPQRGLHIRPWCSYCCWIASLKRFTSPMLGCRGKVKAYYAAEGAFYTASVFMLLLWEERRKDFWAMLLHHAVTFALITASYALS